jgi:hypothetical protein
MGERFFRPARQKSAELLGVIQGFLTQQGEKRAGQMVLDGCEYRFLDHLSAAPAFQSLRSRPAKCPAAAD